ncbi:MAG: hypothetical protein A2161_13965 [Candidatus Schekmanbacteria bacterium RBG_13_48_7]|uniref:Uncharacterized protein n=1 Tax=Candidatus Schekmanbacteria bacterium RBG_13_48_7 TaxID=1817878 RepID=A0A1F7RWQ9_9BACT|nr:MAG: hypothetical protein A2161_13965 [Candidatus Schekmanbacteria bacterium RBG_13_48_7]
MTHSFHPLFSQEFDIIQYRRCWGRDSIIFCDEQKRFVTIPVEWTDAFSEQDPFLVFSSGRSVFRAEDLIRLVELIRGFNS